MKKMIMALLTVAISHSALAKDCKDSDSFTRIINGNAEISRHIMAKNKDYNIVYKGIVKGISMDQDSGRYGDYDEYTGPTDQENHKLRLGRYILVGGDLSGVDTTQNQKAINVRTTGDVISMDIDDGGYSSFRLKVYRSSGDFRANEKISIASVKYNLGDKVKFSNLQCD